MASRRRRLGLSAADQCMSTISNVLFVALAAHVLTARDFGALSLIYVLATSALLIVRAAVGEVLLIKTSSDPSASTGDALATGLTLGLGCALAILVVPVTLGGALAQSAWAICPFIPLLFLQDTLRYLVIAERRAGQALTSDLLWVCCQVALSAAVLVTGSTSLVLVTLTWTVSGSVAALLLWLCRPVRLRFGCRRWLRTQRTIAPYYVVEAVAVNGSAQLFTIGVALIAGLEASGALRAANILFGPINTLVLAASVALVPELVRRREHGNDGLRPAVVIAGALSVVTVGWGVALIAGRDSLSVVFGDTWALAKTVAPYFFVRLLLGSASTGPLLWLRATGRGNATTASRVWTSAITLVAGITGTVLWGVTGAAAGLVVAQLFNVTALWIRALGVRRVQRLASTSRPGAGGSIPAPRVDVTDVEARI